MAGVHLQTRGLTRRFQRGGVVIPVLDALDVELAAGSTTAVVGPSGSGKSTFLHLVGLLGRPDAGTVCFDGADVAGLQAGARDSLRNHRVGFVFQAHHLLAELSAIENVMIPVRLAGGATRVARERAQVLLDAVGLSHRLHHRPGELSGGEQQRVAIARALVMGPGLLLADEPTGNLDPATSSEVFDLLMELRRQLGSTLVVVTHDLALAARFDRRLTLEAGRFVETP